MLNPFNLDMTKMKTMSDSLNAELENTVIEGESGAGMVKAKGTAARIFSAISEAGINIRMIDQGSSELSIIVGVDERDLEKALNAIYDEFVR